MTFDLAMQIAGIVGVIAAVLAVWAGIRRWRK